MHDYFVFLLQIVQAEGNFFLHEDIIHARKHAKLERRGKSEYEGTPVPAWDMDKTNQGAYHARAHYLMYAFLQSMRLLRDV